MPPGRAEEIVEKYIEGTKPAKPPVVTGSVTTSAIKVHVDAQAARRSISSSRSACRPARPAPSRSSSGWAGRAWVPPSQRPRASPRATTTTGRWPTKGSRTGLFTTIDGSNGVSARLAGPGDQPRHRRAGRREGGGAKQHHRPHGRRHHRLLAERQGRIHRRRVRRAHRAGDTAGIRHRRRVRFSNREHRFQGAEREAGSVADFRLDRSAGMVWNRLRQLSEGKVDVIPGDTRSLVAMYAPRGLLVLDNSRIGELCATCQHAASAAGQKVYEALGVGKNIAYNGGNPSTRTTTARSTRRLRGSR